MKGWLQLFRRHTCKNLESDSLHLDDKEVDPGVDVDASICYVFCTRYFEKVWKAFREELEALRASFLVDMKDGWY